METIFTFLLHASSGIVLFYLVFWLFLRKETFYAANRWFLLLALISAVLLPLFPLQYSVLVEAENTKPAIQTIADTFKNIPVIIEQEETINFSWTQALIVIYITGAAIFLLRLLSQTVILIHLMIKYRVKSFNGVRIVENEKYGLPFSFFNIVFLNPKFHTQDELPEILAHETVHIRENHWFDLLFIELLTVIFWFNPFIWFFERSIKQNHEYLADKGVLAQGHTLGKYQAILVNQLMGMQIIGITNNLNFALSTNRLKMMTKKKTPMIKHAKFAFILPIVALLLFAFAEPQYRYENPEDTETDTSMREVLANKSIKLSGLVVDENGDPMPGVSIVIKGGTTGRVSDKQGKFELEVPEDAKIVLSFVGKKTIVNKVSAKNGKYTFIMQDAVNIIYNRNYSGDQMIPPPPPPPPAKQTKKGSTPPPPPLPEKTKLEKGEKEKEVFFVVEDMPKYPGGFEALNEYLEKMQKKFAVQKSVKGQAKVSFTVDAKGKVSDIKVVEKDNDGAAKGAYMIAKEMEDWKPGKQRGKPVPVKYLLPVEFK